jgi:group II intron reverse transcriptase/maturase
MQLACKGKWSKVNSGLHVRNYGLPKGCLYNLLWTAKGKGYATLGKNVHNGDGASIVPSILNEREVGQLKAPGELSVGSDTHSNEAGSENNGQKKTSMYLYHNMFVEQYYVNAYEAIKSKNSSMTPGLDNETLDGFSKEKIRNIIQKMKDRSFQFKPSRIKMLPKPNGKLRKIGIPSAVDKITQRVFKGIIQEIYEPIFLNTSNGFRPNKGTHTALNEIKNWTGITWTLEGDIKGFFDNIDHKILEKLLNKEVKDPNMIGLYWKMVNAGYVNSGHKEITHSITGVPQGNVISPLLSNIYLHEFDKFMESIKSEYTKKGVVSKTRDEYNEIAYKETKALNTLKKLLLEKTRIKIDTELAICRNKIRKVKVELKQYTAMKRNTPSKEKILTRVYYVRYADDWLVGVTGSKKTALEIKERISKYLKEQLKLDLNEIKTKVTHMTRSRAFFLGVEIKTTDLRYARSLRSKYMRNGKTFTRLPSTGRVKMYAPIKKLIEKLKQNGFAKEVKLPEKVGYIINKKGHKKVVKLPECRTRIVPCAQKKFIMMEISQMMTRYEAVLRGYLNYFYFVDNFSNLHHVMYILKYSLICTVARKLRLNTAKVIKKFGKEFTLQITPTKTKTLAFPSTLKNDPEKNVFKIAEFDPMATTYWKIRTVSSLDRDCIICGAKERIEMHHIRGLKNAAPRTYLEQMRAMKRKQIPVCKQCHDKIHKGHYDCEALRKAASK